MLAQLQKRPINATSKQCIQVYKGSIISGHMTGSLLEGLTDKRGNAVKTSLTSADNQTCKRIIMSPHPLSALTSFFFYYILIYIKASEALYWFHGSQDIDVTSLEPIHSFLCHYLYYYIIEEKGCQRRKWVGRHDDAFAGIFCGPYWDTHTYIA